MGTALANTPSLLPISYIANGVGTPLHMDRATANGTKLDSAMVCVDIEVGMHLPDKLRLEI